jgi:16S rRNA U1498 N3-methylase RsmE
MIIIENNQYLSESSDERCERHLEEVARVKREDEVDLFELVKYFIQVELRKIELKIPKILKLIDFYSNLNSIH